MYIYCDAPGNMEMDEGRKLPNPPENTMHGGLVLRKSYIRAYLFIYLYYERRVHRRLDLCHS